MKESRKEGRNHGRKEGIKGGRNQCRSIPLYSGRKEMGNVCVIVLEFMSSNTGIFCQFSFPKLP